MQGITGFGHVAIKVTDLDRSLAFWEQGLGFPSFPPTNATKVTATAGMRAACGDRRLQRKLFMVSSRSGGPAAPMAYLVRKFFACVCISVNLS